MSSLNKKQTSKPSSPKKSNVVFDLNQVQTSVAALRRAIMTCMLWEKPDAKSTIEIEKHVAILNSNGELQQAVNLAIEAKTQNKLRHVPLLVARFIIKHDLTFINVQELFDKVIARPDDVGEFLTIYYATNNGKKSVPHKVLNALGNTFKKFNEYTLAKWDKNNANIKLRDSFRITHPVPDTIEQATLWSKVVSNTLDVPETRETLLSSGMPEYDVYYKLLSENKLGANALLKNLKTISSYRDLTQMAKVAINEINSKDILPFQYVVASLHAPSFKEELSNAMFRSLNLQTKYTGRTTVLVDVSGSMGETISGSKSTVTRFQASSSLAVLACAAFEDATVYSFSNRLVEVDTSKLNLDLISKITNSQPNGGTQLSTTFEQIDPNTYDRIIVITDEETSDRISLRDGKLGYIVNVGRKAESLDTKGGFQYISGWSEHVIKYINMVENNEV